METKKDLRSNLDISNQAKNMFIRVYEQLNGVNVYGYLPDKSVGDPYQRTKRECISICIRYEDKRLQEEYERNF